MSPSWCRFQEALAAGSQAAAHGRLPHSTAASAQQALSSVTGAGTVAKQVELETQRMSTTNAACMGARAGSLRPAQGAALARAVAAGIALAQRPRNASCGHAAQLVPRQLHLLPQRLPVRDAPADGARAP